MNKDRINATMEVDLPFLKSTKGLLKIAEMVCVFVAFVCYAVASRPPYIAVTCMEFFITFGFLLLYLLKLNKMFTFFFWPLIDVFNSFFAAALMCILSLVAVSTYTVKGTLSGGVRMYTSSIPGTLSLSFLIIVGFVAAAFWSLDGCILFKKITFNKSRTTTEAQTGKN
ncbi:chemokine-like factor isoform X1 [Megalobrama amblycephala]|uniref:chemokine-like factor isoform X1 n=1 Tax=Megalobrama amblycephala TaxID=75352 RepID=UPI00201401B8|nr:chemokine-like factor isoform X1 [Megalobrama amblycephala]